MQYHDIKNVFFFIDKTFENKKKMFFEQMLKRLSF